ncbi:MAG: AMP-binding protein [Chloroflexota bacterium]
MAGLYVQLLRHMTAGPMTAVADLDILGDTSVRSCCIAGTTRRRRCPGSRPISGSRSRQPATRRARPSAAPPGRSATASSTRKRTVWRDTCERSAWAPTGWWASTSIARPRCWWPCSPCSKAGGAYVPLDPLFPDERLAMIATDAGLQVLVTQESLAGQVVAPGAAVVVLERDQPRIDALDPTDLGLSVGPTDLAYAIYTSGSTGRPKGVEIPHVALSNLLESMRREPGLSPRTGCWR